MAVTLSTHLFVYQCPGLSSLIPLVPHGPHRGFLHQSCIGTLHCMGPWLFQRQFLDSHLPCVERKEVGKSVGRTEAAWPVHLCDELLASRGKMDGTWHQQPTHAHSTASAARTVSQRHRCAASSKDSPLNHWAPKTLVALVGQRDWEEQRFRDMVFFCILPWGKNPAGFGYFL